MTKSPFQLIVMVLFALAALVAVGVLSGVITLPKSAKESVQGSVVAWGTLDEKTFRFSTNFLKTLNKNVLFEYVQQPIENFESLLNEAIASGRGPDIIIISQEQILRNKSKIAAQKISSSDSIDYKEKYINGADLLITNEGLLGVPLAANPLVMYYNDRLLTSAGFPTPPKFWDEMQAYIDALTIKNDDRNIERSAVALGVFENTTYPLDILSALLLQSGAPIISPELQYNTNKEAFTVYKSNIVSSNTDQVLEFFNAFSNPQKKLYSWNTSLPLDIDAFTSEFSTFWFGYPTDEAIIKAKNPNLNYKIAAIPQVRNSKNVLTYGKIYSVSILKSSPNPSAAAFIQQNLTMGTPQQILVEDAGLQYPYRIIPESAMKSESATFYARQAVQIKGYYMPSYSFTYSLFKRVIDQITSGAITSSDASKRLELELNDYIGKNQL